MRINKTLRLNDSTSLLDATKYRQIPGILLYLLLIRPQYCIYSQQTISVPAQAYPINGRQLIVYQAIFMVLFILVSLFVDIRHQFFMLPLIVWLS